MLKLLLAFGAGWYFGRNPGAGQQVVAAGRQLLDAQTGEPVATNVLPDTRVVGPQCPAGFLYYSGGIQQAGCVDRATYAMLMSGQLVQAARGQ